MARLKDKTYQEVRKKFKAFLALLDHNYTIIANMNHLEMAVVENRPITIDLIKTRLELIRDEAEKMIDNLVEIGGDEYRTLHEKLNALYKSLEGIVPGYEGVVKDEFVLPFEQISRDRLFSVGGKCAQLVELLPLGIPVPRGFAISAYANKYFLEANGLQNRINDLLASVDCNRIDELNQVSRIIKGFIENAEIPSDLEDTILKAFFDLRSQIDPARVALRSSAIGEDAFYSFAGQYATFLNVHSHDLIYRYRDILASKFTPKAIYYYLSHKLTEAHLLMGVICIETIDAEASGVMYTSNPVEEEDDQIHIYSLYGLGRSLVNGNMNPDLFTVSLEKPEIVQRIIREKHKGIFLKADGGTMETAIPEEKKKLPSISDENILQLAVYARELETHFGSPQNVEWVVDREGCLFILQTRPLRIVRRRSEKFIVDLPEAEILAAGGRVVCPGAGAGEVVSVASTADLEKLPVRAILVARNPFPEMITILDRAAALVTEVGSDASHMATIAREYRVPVITGIRDAVRKLTGKEVTVDATGKKIYQGLHPAFVEVRNRERGSREYREEIELLRRIMKWITPLNLINPAGEDFCAANCSSLHDITRFCHQRGIEELFDSVKDEQYREKIGCKLKTEIPLSVNILSLDPDEMPEDDPCWLDENDIYSRPMASFWRGIQKQGWPKSLPKWKSAKTFSIKKARPGEPDDSTYSTSSFAIISKEYMLLSLRMGFHFLTVEGMCSKNPAKNYIKFRHKGGGSTLERRIRRIRLFARILQEMGFVHSIEADYLDTMLSIDSEENIEKKLEKLGRLTLMTKQLDMALSSDNITEWYIKDFLKQLNIVDQTT